MPRLQRDLRFAPTGFVEYWILVSGCWILVTGYRFPVKNEYRASSIEYLALYCSNVNANDIFISDSGLPGLELMT